MADLDLTSKTSGTTISGLALWQWRQQAQAQAETAGIPVAEVDWLLQAVAGLDRLSLHLASFKEREIQLQLSLIELEQLWQQRLQHVPIQYLVGATPWRQFSLMVSPAVLIPRPETELIIDLVLAAVQDRRELRAGHWADLGTGSGAIALGLAAALPAQIHTQVYTQVHTQIHAVDAIESALAVAQQNAERTGLAAKIQFYQGSWFTPLAQLRGQLSGMVSNPPYIPHSMLTELQAEVQKEPQSALDGGIDGLDCIRELVSTAPDYLKSGGLWLIEMMAGQAEAVAQLLEQQGEYRDIQIHADLAGIDRFALAYRR
jgi:release factor glutamine methyltransferase